MNRAQRIVVVIASGLGLALAAATRNRLANDAVVTGGWFAYSPNTGAQFTPDGSSASVWWAGLTWLVAIVVWCVLAVWLLRSRGDSPER